MLASGGSAGAARYDPALRFRTLTTPHFVIHFQEGTEPLARRLATIVEEVHADLGRRLPPRFRARTHVILVDQTDLASAWATPLPYNTIELAATWPGGDSTIGNTDDWLRLAFAHEYAHILHLDRSGGLPAAARRVFGRIPFGFPNLFLPQWQVEGLATREETVHTGAGRVPAGDFGQILWGAARAGRLEPLDRINGGLIAWPAGAAPYVYGAYFHEHLAEEFGADSIARLADATAGRLPYFGAGAFRDVFGERLGSLWGAFTESAAHRALEQETGRVPLAAAPAARRLTTHGFVVEGPRWDPRDDGRIFYSIRNPRTFPALMAVPGNGGTPERVTWRFFGDSVAVGREGIFFHQLQFARNLALHGDLYVAERRSASGRRRGGGARARAVRRLTVEARVADVDLGPDETRLACVVRQPDRRSLHVLALGRDGQPLSAPEPVVSEAGVYFATPRWSPDGLHIAAERRRLRGPSELVLVDLETRAVRVLASAPPARHVTPAWTPDGRTILFASDRRGGLFDIYAVDVDTGAEWQVTRFATGARSPDVSPDGRTIVFVGYTTDGYDLFVTPLDRGTWKRLDDSVTPRQWGDTDGDSAFHPVRGATSSVEDAFGARAYTPWPTLLPRAWLPVVERSDDRWKLGALTFGTDVLGRHGYEMSALRGQDARGLDWHGAYAYTRWRPAVFASGTSESYPWRGTHRRAETADLGVLLPVRRVRHAQSWLASVRLHRDRPDEGSVALDGGPDAAAVPAITRHALRLGWTFSSARAFGYSISPEEGVSLGLTSEHVRPAFGASGVADAASAEFRAYQRLGPPPAVIAVRAAAGIATGDPVVRRTFSAGGSGPRRGLIGFDRESLGLLRGFDAGAITGRQVVVLNLDYRVPLTRIERGRGTWPVFVRTLHAAAFADIGHAWDEDFRPGSLQTSIGLEASLDTVLGYYAPVTFAAGAAWRRDPTGRVREGVAGFVRVGRAF